jgi:hypothetical protein
MLAIMFTADINPDNSPPADFLRLVDIFNGRLSRDANVLLQKFLHLPTILDAAFFAYRVAFRMTCDFILFEEDMSLDVLLVRLLVL